MAKLYIEGRVCITHKLNQYDTDLSFLCDSGLYNTDVFYNNDGSIDRITINSQSYGITEYTKEKMLLCNLTNSNSYIAVGDDNILFENDGIQYNKKDGIQLIIANRYIVANTIKIGHETVVDISVAKNVDNIVIGIELKFNYTSYLF